MGLLSRIPESRELKRVRGSVCFVIISVFVDVSGEGEGAGRGSWVRLVRLGWDGTYI